MLFRSACAVRPCRVQRPSLGLPEDWRGPLRNPFAVVDEILREELHYDELSVEGETAVAQQIPNFCTRQNARGFNAGTFREEGSPEIRA